VIFASETEERQMTGIWNGTFREPAYWTHFGTRLVHHAQLATGARVLDGGTGTGAVLLPAADAVGRHGYLVGIDVWGPCVTATTSAIRERGLQNAAAARMDMGRLAFPDGSFDAVLSGFVGWDDVYDFERYRFLAPDRKLEEIRRVLRDGGLVGMSSWAMQDDNEWMGQLVAAHLPALHSGEPGAGQTRRRYSKETAIGMEKMLLGAGFRAARVLTEFKEFTYADEGGWLQGMRYLGWHPEVEEIKALPAERLRTFEEDALERLRGHKHADGIHFGRTVIFGFAVK
jgi:ubiquinone/menaquinone biosynthesis C-methylase UbiE